MTTLLAHTLAEVRAVVHRVRLAQQTEDSETHADVEEPPGDLVEPVLTALGWDIEDDLEVRRAFRIDGSKDRTCIALLPSGTPLILIEVRRLGQALDSAGSLPSVLRHASAAGFGWVVLTDGDEYRVYSSRSDLPGEERLYGVAHITDDIQCKANELLGLFLRQRIEEDRISSSWRRQLVDRQVRKTVENMLSPDASFVRLLVRKTTGLSSKDIRDSLSRADFSVSFVAREEVGSTGHQPDLLSKESHSPMSDAELRIATWLQQRSFDRWAREKHRGHNHRTGHRRTPEERRSNDCRRVPRLDRRNPLCAEVAEDRRAGERRGMDRRAGVERRIAWDRRRVLREA